MSPHTGQPMSTGRLADPDPFAPSLVTAASGLLRTFNRVGVLAAADVHVARQLGALAAESDEAVLLAVALAVRGPRLGHVHVDLSTIRATAAVDTEDPVDLSTLPWPDPQGWLAAVAASPLVAEDAGAVRPLRRWGSWLYLDRYWAEEVAVATALLERSGAPAVPVDAQVLAAGLRRLFGPDADGRQRQAAAAVVRAPFAVVAGGPGTGKTTTVARIVALLAEQAEAQGRPFPLVALAAPTGKAAARLQEAVHAEAASLVVSEPIRAGLLELSASTLHRLLGWRPGSISRFRHDRHRHLAHDVVIVDETSMVSLSLMARLIEALRNDARLVLVGDPGQLASIEAGAVLGDIVGPAAEGGPTAEPSEARAEGGATAEPASEAAAEGGPTAKPVSETTAEGGPPAKPRFGAGIVVLERVHRFGGGIAKLAAAVRRGDGDAVIALLESPPEGIEWIPGDVVAETSLEPVRGQALAGARAVLEAARAGEAERALAAVSGFRILCAHRRGPYGVASWTARLESWLEPERGDPGRDEPWYVGRPLLVTENDYELGLHNGDTGVVIEADGRVEAVFARAGRPVPFSPSRLGAVDTAYAMTIHKSQGSQFDAAAVLLPGPDSRILTRELLYTAATRARRRLILVGTEAAVRAAVARPVARASGLRRRLWGEEGG